MGKNNSSTTEIDCLIGERVRSRRLRAKVSQAALGEALGVTFQQVQKYESGANRIGCGRLMKIAEVLECDVGEFYGNQATASTPFSKFMATKDGVAIVEAMLKIKNQALRRTVIDIAEKLAEAQARRAKPADRDIRT
jgi:transcriptional regulator with XRE-family HTH domain